MNRNEKDAKFETIHKAGSEKHGALWLRANQIAVELAMAYDLDYVEHRAAISHIIKWVLDVAENARKPHPDDFNRQLLQERNEFGLAVVNLMQIMTVTDKTERLAEAQDRVRKVLKNETYLDLYRAFMLADIKQADAEEEA